ncbi:MAG: tol-pal system protein YbgF [candidate division Zixibacteria bacterium]|nr:tol-pal system protein YbgF [candidate division Zixibacteria bacterium]
MMNWKRITTLGPMMRTGAVIILGVLISAGCASRAEISKMSTQLDYLEASQKRIERDLIRIDSLVTENTEAANRTRADVGSSLDEFRRDALTMREAIDELRRQIEREPKVIYQPVPGGGDDTSSTDTGTTTADIIPDIDPSQLYENAFLDVRKGNYELAIQQFRDVLEFFGNTDYAPNARYWIGECYYSLEQYDSAIVEFDALLENHPMSERIPTALYKMGRCYEEVGRPTRARTYYERVIEEYPNSLEAKPSQSRLAQIR